MYLPPTGTSVAKNGDKKRTKHAGKLPRREPELHLAVHCYAKQGQALEKSPE